jgi:hypothetical protein
MRLYTFRSFADAGFLLGALALAVASTLLILATLVDHLQNYKYPALQVGMIMIAYNLRDVLFSVRSTCTCA